MSIREIAKLPTVIDGVHESCFRSYHILRYVESLLEQGTPPTVSLQLLRELCAFDSTEVERTKKTLDFSIARAMAGV